jgi:phage regulator Rha-like protein
MKSQIVTSNKIENMKNTQIKNVEDVEEKIYLIRGQRVMIDSDLAEVYQVETKMLNRAVKRNLNRFPTDFMFQLTEDEIQSLRFQIGTSNEGRGGRRYLPYVFTEHGAVMLASVLNSPTAIEASIKVVRAFVQMRSILALHQDLADRIEELEKTTNYHSEKFGVVSGLLGEIFRNPKYLKRKIGFVEEEKKKK